MLRPTVERLLLHAALAGEKAFAAFLRPLKHAEWVHLLKTRFSRIN